VPRNHNGGAVVDLEGKVLGINLASGSFDPVTKSGVMYAIPADVVRKFIAEVRKSVGARATDR
jgi:S1-C subfamily serine protease